MVRRLRDAAPGASIVRTRVLRASVAAPPGGAFLAGRARGRVIGYDRRAKNVLIHLETGWTVRIQLGMTGHVYFIPDARKPPRFARLLFILEGGGALVFEDARTFGNAAIYKTRELPGVLAAYGPEPLDASFRWTGLEAAARGLRQPVKPFLMDQRRIAGLGNIWAAEALFVAGIHPARSVKTLGAADWKKLHHAIRTTLRRAIANTFTVTHTPEEFPEADLLNVNVYGRENEPCRRCRQPVRRQIQAARATYFCPVCQK